MKHHKHPGIVGTLSKDKSTLDVHPDAKNNVKAYQVWVAIPDKENKAVSAIELISCVKSREGAMRVVAIPHAAYDLTLNDEIAVDKWEENYVARGLLASSLLCTLRVVVTNDKRWLDAAIWIDELVQKTANNERAWFDVISDQAVAIAVPRTSLRVLIDELSERAARNELRWEYTTALRHQAEYANAPK